MRIALWLAVTGCNAALVRPLNDTASDADADADADADSDADADADADADSDADADADADADSDADSDSDTDTDPNADLDGDGFVASDDCDDGNAAAHPGAVEACDGFDTDCDPTTSEDGTVLADGIGYTSIADAVFHASVGAEVVVCAGTYVETVSVDHHVTIRGVGQDVVIVDGDGNGPVFDINVPDVIIEGLTITNGRASQGAAINLTSVTGTILRDLRMTGNEATSNGGAMYLNSSSDATLERVTVDNNQSAGQGGAFHLYYYASITCTDCLFQDNTTDSNGGALYVGYSSTAELVDSVIDGNSAPQSYGGGIYADDSDIDLLRTAVTTNTAFDGGGIWLDSGSTTLTADDTDWGLGGTENQPNDVGSSYLDIGYYQGAATFDCDPYSCQ